MRAPFTAPCSVSQCWECWNAGTLDKQKTKQGRSSWTCRHCQVPTSRMRCSCRVSNGHGQKRFCTVYTSISSSATPKHCSTGQGRSAPLLFSAALPNRLTARLCHCNYTYLDLLFTQVCSDATPKHCSTGQSRMQSPLFSLRNHDWSGATRSGPISSEMRHVGRNVQKHSTAC